MVRPKAPSPWQVCKCEGIEALTDEWVKASRGENAQPSALRQGIHRQDLPRQGNLTLAAAPLNCHQKGGKDAAEWLPARNRYWFAARVVAVRRGRPAYRYMRDGNGLVCE